MSSQEVAANQRDHREIDAPSAKPADGAFAFQPISERMGNSRAPPVRVAQQSATLAAWVHCLTKADTRGEDERRGAGSNPAAPGPVRP